VTASAVPACPHCGDPAARWTIDSPVRAHDRVRLDTEGLEELGLVVPDGGLEPLDRPIIACASCGEPAFDAVRDAVLRAATAAARGEAPRFDA
jgi:hypothetical protein